MEKNQLKILFKICYEFLLHSIKKNQMFLTHLLYLTYKTTKTKKYVDIVKLNHDRIIHLLNGFFVSQNGKDIEKFYFQT